jgi:hypothetical protein
MALRMSQAKGSILIHCRDFVVRYHGEDALKAIMAELSAEDAAVFGGLVIHGGWYPVGAWNRAVRALVEGYYEDPDDGMRKLSGYISNADLNSVYRMVLRFGSPEFLVKRTTSLWNRYFDTGRFTADEMGPKHWRLVLEAPRGDDEGPDYYTCGPGVCSWLGQGLKLTGVHGSVEHIRCRLSSAPYCEYTARW